MDKDFISENLERIYESYDSILLEGLKKKSDREIIQKNKAEFIRYLAFKYQDRDIKYEFKHAETDKEKEEIVDRYSKDFKEWLAREKGLKSVLVAAASSIGFTIAGYSGAAQLLCVMAWGRLLKVKIDDVQAVEKAKEEEYLKNRHKK